MVNTRTDAELAAAVQAAVDAMLPQIREQVREEYRTGAVASGSNPPPVTIHTWLERFNKQKPRSFEKAVAPVDAENWISHMEKIFDVMDCNDAFKTRLAVYKFEGDALAWWKAYKQAKGGDAWVLTLTWAAFKELFFLQFFPRAENNDNSVLDATKGNKVRNPTELPTRSHVQGNPLQGYTHPLFATHVELDTQEVSSVAAGNFASNVAKAGHLHGTCKKNTGASVSVFVLFDTGATHSVISTKFASCFTMTPILLDHVLFISTPMKDSARISHVYRDLPLQFDDKIRSVNALPLDMCEFDIIQEVGYDSGNKVEEEIIRDLERLDIELCVRGQNGFWASLRVEPNLISQIYTAYRGWTEKSWALFRILGSSRTEDSR
ncbi:zinc finger, CCHC-type, retrotransposon gag domain protein [Tanacetum coccineum]